MRIIGCDLHAAQQTIAMLDRDTGEIVERTLSHEGTTVRDFYTSLPPPIVVGIEATGSMRWFVRLMEELRITCRVGDPAKIRQVETRRQKHDRRDAALLLQLLSEDRFPAIWMPPAELCELRELVRHRDQWVRLRARVKNALQGLALAHGLRRRAGLWTQRGQATLAALPLAPYASDRRSALQALHDHLTTQIDALDQRVGEQARERPQARRLMTHPGVGPVTALATEVFVGDPFRFADAKALASYAGLVPSEYSSGDRQRLGKLTKQGKGYEYEKGRYVVLTKEDFESAAVERNSRIDVLDFVDGQEVDDRYFDKPYYLLPGKGGEHSYAVFRDALRESGRIGIAKFVIG